MEKVKIKEKYALRAKLLHKFWRRYKMNKAGVLGLIILTFIVFMALFSNVIAPFDPMDNSFGLKLAPNSVNWFGTDQLGRDIFSRVIYGARISLTVGFCASLASTILGVIVGSIAGYFGKTTDIVFMKITEAFQVFPQFFVAILFAAFFGSSIWMVILIIGLLSWPSCARIVRGEFLSLKEQEFVCAAKSTGTREHTIIFYEILPSAMPQVIVNASLRMATAILTEAALNFFGCGDPTGISWGKMLNDAQGYLRIAPWTSIFPGVAILFTVLSINLVGDALNDALNPKFRER